MVAKLQKPMLIVTTNYDRLVENAFKEEGRTDFDIVVHSTIRAYANCVLFRRGDATSEDFEPVALGELSRRIDLKKRTVIYKMHGSVSVNRDWDSFVINEEDYVDFLGRMNKTEPVIPPIFTTYFREKSFLFLGYSLRDWNLRIVLHNLQLEDAFDDNRHWAIQYYPTLAERELWDKRKVSIFHVELLAFVRRLATEFGLPPADENGSGQ